jgi:hypothetical protein
MQEYLCSEAEAAIRGCHFAQKGFVKPIKRMSATSRRRSAKDLARVAETGGGGMGASLAPHHVEMNPLLDRALPDVSCPMMREKDVILPPLGRAIGSNVSADKAVAGRSDSARFSSMVAKGENLLEKVRECRPAMQLQHGTTSGSPPLEAVNHCVSIHQEDCNCPGGEHLGGLSSCAFDPSAERAAAREPSPQELPAAHELPQVDPSVSATAEKGPADEVKTQGELFNLQHGQEDRSPGQGAKDRKVGPMDLVVAEEMLEPSQETELQVPAWLLTGSAQLRRTAATRSLETAPRATPHPSVLVASLVGDCPPPVARPR